MMRAALYGCTAVAALLWLPSLFIPIPPLSLNDLHLRWLIAPGAYFTAAPARPGMVCTNPELTALDNGTECFTPRKKPGTFRIFCVGGSTTRGWPFQHVITYPALLASYLEKALPGREIEVINAGFMASDSVSDLPLVRELARYEPDLLLLYEGRADVGNYDLRSAFSSRLLQIHCSLLRNSAVYGRLRLMLQPSAGLDHARSVRLLLFLVPRASFEGYAPFFLGNIRSMGAAAAAAGAKTILLTQVTFPPAGAPVPEGVSGLRRAAGLEITRREAFVLRANDWLRDFSAREKIPLLDFAAVMEAAREKESGLMIPLPAVHPDLAGYCLMARAAAQYLKNAGIPAPARQWGELPPAAEVCAAELAFSHGRLKDTYLRLGDYFSAAGYPAAAKRYRARALEYGTQ
ncbi:MAG: SGNH/GDSL hydrolase family protein [Elusimicrobia bacterium]|nr:SGNH/GDSL hydrolase family protein [Elusimicrobiota bacterium]